MKRKKKGKKLRLIIQLGLVIPLIFLSYFSYAFVYRGQTELPPKSERTNQGSAVYSLEHLKDILSEDETFLKYAFAEEEREYEKEYGTYIIPGMLSTRTLVAGQGDEPGICTSMTPQGLAVTEDYVLISAYCHTKKHNSVIYVLDKENHSFIKELVVPGKPHLGGLAYDPVNQIIWASSNAKGIAQAISFTLESLEKYDLDKNREPVEIFQECNLYGIVRDSFMTYYQGSLYVGCFTKGTSSVLCRYSVGEDGRLVTQNTEDLGMDFEMAVPRATARISEKAQGMAFYQDHLLLSQSYGVLPSQLLFFKDSDEHLFINEVSVMEYKFPEKLEQIYVDGDYLYLLFESSAYAYRASSFRIVDRVIRLNLKEMTQGLN